MRFNIFPSCEHTSHHNKEIFFKIFKILVFLEHPFNSESKHTFKINKGWKLTKLWWFLEARKREGPNYCLWVIFDGVQEGPVNENSSSITGIY